MAEPRSPQVVTPAEYQDFERRSQQKHEYLAGRVFAMAGASRFHNRTKENLIGEMFTQLKGGPCQSYSSDQRVRTPH